MNTDLPKARMNQGKPRRFASWLFCLVFLTSILACGFPIQVKLPTRSAVSTSAPVGATGKLSAQQPSVTPFPSPTRTLAPTPTPTPQPLTVFIQQIPAPSLRENLLNEPNEQPVQIYLPPSYESSGLHYPVVYFLPGYGSEFNGEDPFLPAEKIAALMSSHKIKEMILVVPDGANVLHGSFYVNSPVTGNWEDFITKDVIGYIDSNYRTLANPTARGIAGHSMGGFGAFNLAMRHPDLFTASYSISSTFFDEDGLGASMMFDKDTKSFKFFEEREVLSSLPDEEAIKKMAGYEVPLSFTIAYGAAFSPDPEAGPPYIEFPQVVKNGKLKAVPGIWERWQNGFGGWQQKIEEYHDNLTQLSGIVIDYGTEDRYHWIPPGSEYLSKLLTEAGIANEIYSFEGGHGERMPRRMLDVMLPFFDRVLDGPTELNQTQESVRAGISLAENSYLAP